MGGVEAELKWRDDLVLSVAGKMFCALCLWGPQRGAVGFKVDDARLLELTGQPGFEPASYPARAKWMQVPVPERIGDAELRALIRRSYELVRGRLTRRLRHELAG